MNQAACRIAGAWLGVIALASLPVLADYQAGLDAFKRGDVKRAIEEFQLEIQKHPNYDYGHFMLGICHLKLKELDKAVASLKKAAELDKEKLVYHTNLAQAYTELKQWDSAVKALEGKTELRSTPDVTGQAHFLLGFGYFNTKKHDKAAEHLAAAKKLMPNDFKVLSPLGIVQFLRGDFDDAISNLGAAVKINPKHGQTSLYLGEAYLAKAQRETDPKKKQLLYQSATKYAEETVKLAGPQDFEAINLLARAYLGSDRFQEAVVAFEKAIALNPKHGYAHFNRGEAYKGLKDWASAEKEYLKAAELLPGSADVLSTLAFTYEQLAKQDDGASLDNSLAYYQKAQALKAKTSTRDAIARVQENLRIRDENRAIDAENKRIEDENLRKQEEYARKLKEQEEYERKRQEYLQDKGLVEKKRAEDAANSPPSGSPNH